MPDWRIAPPKRNLPSHARSISLRRAGEDRAERAAEALREADRDGVGERAPRPQARSPAATAALKSRAPSRWTAAPRSRAASTAARNSSSGQMRPPELRCVFSSTTHAARPELVDLLDLLRRRPPRVGDEPVHDEAGVDRRAAPLVDEDVRPLLGEELAAGPAEHAQRDLVRHRRGRQEERRLVAEQLGHPALQLVVVGSSRYCSSPTSAAAIAASIAGVGFVRVSERRSIIDRGRYRSPMDLTLLETTLRERGEPAYRARQVWEWTARGAAGYDAMTNLPRALRDGARRGGAVLDARRSRRSASRTTAR